ncbi:2-dehydro-3-deoxygluconokinase [Maioricimonas rarisocia]|uniref:2-dehydro-3-deoxygluconokinase n=1 Tax=Maioricimonas rarisocia TaxID=2528026 RepID=A0A517Z909_9PLAN|nr:carbohydrate kinase [Maioricimonas rarisocia]QDU38921.1 2-dehydro-3-deoxygluconokinase [Maioricimonas rarisocia]
MSEAAPIVIGLGELLWDVFPDRRLPGGAPANVAFQAGQLGCRGVVASRVGTDDLGDELCSYLDEKGLDSSYVQRDPEHPTGRVTVELSDDGQPDFTIHEHVAWDFLAFEEPLQQVAGEASAVCFGTLAQRSPIARQTIHSVLAATPQNCLRVYDVNLRQQFYDRSWVEPSLEKASVVKLNHDEVGILAGQLELPTDPIGFAGAVQDKFAIDWVCITRGADGCLIATNDETVDVPGRPIEVVDTVGAGDAFTAALITTRLEGWPLRPAAEFANRVGGLVASRSGAMPTLTEELAELRTEFGRQL